MKLIMRFDVEERGLLFYFPESPYKQKLLEICKKCSKKYNGYAMVDLEAPYKSRTTGKGSQNNLYWKLATVIANEIGEDVEDVSRDLKLKAISKGYPYKVSKITGSLIPYSTTKVNTVQMSYLIDTAYEVIAFLGIELSPDLKKE